MKRIDGAMVAKILGSVNSAQILGGNKNSYIVVKHLRGTMPCTDNGSKTTGDMTGFKSWHTPCLDKHDDKEQNLTSEINQALWLSPVIEEEPNECGNVSSVSDTHNQISSKNTAEDRPKIRIKSMLDLQDNSDRASTAETPFVMKKLSSIFQFDKKYMPTAQIIPDNIPKNVEVKGKRKRSDDELSGNKRVRV